MGLEATKIRNRNTQGIKSPLRFKVEAFVLRGTENHGTFFQVL